MAAKVTKNLAGNIQGAIDYLRTIFAPKTFDRFGMTCYQDVFTLSKADRPEGMELIYGGPELTVGQESELKELSEAATLTIRKTS